MQRFLRRLFDLFEVYLPAAVFALLIGSIFVQVFMRYVLNLPSPKLFEVSIYSFVWVIYLGGALATRYDQHVRFDLVYRLLPRPARLSLDILFDLFTTVVMLILVGPSFRYTFQVYGIKASALRIPWTFLLIVFPVFLVLVILHNLIAIWFHGRELLGGGPAPREVPPWQ